MNVDASQRAVQAVSAAMPWLARGSRRDLLRVGALALAGSMPLGRMFGSGQGLAAEATHNKLPPPTAKSVIFLWMAGGVTHHDSFDPKPEAPEKVRGTLSTISTRLPGVHFSEVMPRCAEIADKLALVRSFASHTDDHLLGQAYSLSGREVNRTQLQTEPNIGSVVAYLQGPRARLPGYIAVPGITRPGPPPYNLFGGGWLGPQYGPFATGGEPEQPDFTVGEKEANPSATCNEDLRPKALQYCAGLDADRLSQRAALRGELDRALATAQRLGQAGAMDAYYHDAFHLLSSSSVRAAFDLGSESDQTRDLYGRTKLGGRCLLARRIVEAGARFVLVDYGYDPDYGNFWDNHCVPEQKQPHICEIAKRGYHLAGMDRAFAGLIVDLERRGMLDSTMVIFMTEFGRTPNINPAGGRDHWGSAGSIFFAGGGTRGGQVIGQTDRLGAYCTTPSYSSADVAATLYRAIGIDTATVLYDRQQRPMAVLPVGAPIPGVLG